MLVQQKTMEVIRLFCALFILTNEKFVSSVGEGLNLHYWSSPIPKEDKIPKEEKSDNTTP